MGLMDILNGMQNGPRGGTGTQNGGGMSPITMAVLALLAYKALKQTGGSRPASAPAGTPQVPPAGGGIGDILGGILGGGGMGGGLGNVLKGGLGGLLAGGAAGGILSQGLNDVLKQFEQSGQGDVAKSWVGTGPNRQISPEDLGKALGDETTNSLAEQAGLSKIELLQGMSQQLPHLVDQLTPDGRVPNEHEMSRLI